MIVDHAESHLLGYPIQFICEDEIGCLPGSAIEVMLLSDPIAAALFEIKDNPKKLRSSARTIHSIECCEPRPCITAPYRDVSKGKNPSPKTNTIQIISTISRNVDH